MKLRLVVAGLLVATLLMGCTGSGPSQSEIEKNLIGTEHVNFGYGLTPNAGILVTKGVQKVQRGESYMIEGTEVFPVRVLVKTTNKRGPSGEIELTYIFYKNKFGEWVAQEQE